MRKKTWHRIASAVIAGVMAAQCAAPVLTYADDDTSSTISTATENSDVQVNPGEAVDVTDNETSNDTAASSDLANPLFNKRSLFIAFARDEDRFFVCAQGYQQR